MKNSGDKRVTIGSGWGVGSGSLGYAKTPKKDPRLGRDVAVNVLPAAFAADRERLSRFEQEVR